MKKLFLVITVFVFFSGNLFATNVRGYLEKCSDDCNASTLTQVMLCSAGRELIQETYSGDDGFYYFYDLAPGNYQICVISNDKEYWYKINIKDSEWQDIPVLKYNF